MNIKDTVYDIAKNDHELENSELQELNKIDDLVVCRSVADYGNYKTRTIREFADTRIALDVEEKGAVKMQGKVFNFSKGYKTKVQNLDNLIQWMTERNLTEDVIKDIGIFKIIYDKKINVFDNLDSMKVFIKSKLKHQFDEFEKVIFSNNPHSI